MEPNQVRDTAHILSAVLAPVFFISGVGALINTMATRYARVIDRAQLRLAQLTGATAALRVHLTWEIHVLYQRARILRLTIILMICSVFFTMLTMALLFAKMRWDVSVGFTTEVFFLFALATTTAGLGLFIRDFAVSLRTLKAEVQRGLAAAKAS